MPFFVVLILFFLSGFASLVLEVTWSRQIGLLFGHTVQASSIVLASYFSGMTIGYLIGRRLTGVANPLRAYGICEILAGLWALAIPTIISATSQFSHLFSLQESVGLQITVRALYALLLLLPSTIAMGATLPFIAAFTDRMLEKSRDKKLILAYSFNTVGAVTGTAIATSILFMAFGVTGSSMTGSIIALAVGISAVILSRRLPDTATTDTNLEKKEAPARSAQVGSAGSMRTRYALAGISGFATLSLQVLYVRLFSLVFHNSVYSFGTVLIAFLLSLALASFLFSRFQEQLTPINTMATLQQVGGIAVATSILSFLLLTDLEYYGEVGNFTVYMLSCIALTVGIICVPVTICGMLLPWTWLHPDRNAPSVAEDLGGLSAFNTAAAVLGSLITCFVLLPTIGIWASFGLIATLYVISGVIIIGTKAQVQKFTFAGVALVFVWAAMTVSAKQHDGSDEGDIIKRFESAYGWVDVIKTENSNLKLRQNIHYGLGSSSSMSMERRQGHLPLLLHPDPKNVLFIGLATGITASAAVDHASVENIDIVELVPDVVRAAAEFHTYNKDVLTHAKTKIYINDGRHFLNQSAKKYDVIISDLFVPWESMTGYLYTVDHYTSVLAKLKPGGLFAQWLPLWQVSSTELELIVDSLAAVFPYTNIFYGKNDYHWTILGFIGSATPIAIDSAKLEERLKQNPTTTKRDKSWFLTSTDLYNMYIGTWPKKADVLLNTDDFPRVEFSTPISAWTKNKRLRFATLASYRDTNLNELPMDGGLLINHALPNLDEIRNEQNRIFKKSKD